MSRNNQHNKKFILNVSGKAILFFLLFNLLFMGLPVEKWLGKVSLYNRIFPGRWRLPWSENPTVAYNLSTNNLDALFLSHEVSGNPHSEDEFRVFIFGDSSVWGFLLQTEETLSELLNSSQLTTPDGRPIRAYNLGYPTISLAKDLLLISESLRYQPDLIVWLVTLEAFPKEKQIFTPLVQVNEDEVNALIKSNNLDLDEYQDDFVAQSLLDQTIPGKRKEIADLIRLQLYGVMWAGTGVDQDIPDSFSPLKTDYEEDDSFYDFSPPNLNREDLSLDVLQAGVDLAGDIPVLIVNEPIYISSGKNSDIRYNFFYPKWAYDDYRHILIEKSVENGWHYIDLWDQIPPGEFTNSAIHITAEGSTQLAELIGSEIIGILDNGLD
jgi:hypothetical protein